MFNGDEADLVRQVLGKTPAETVLALCKEHAAKTPN
jgi:hypothetical protein